MLSMERWRSILSSSLAVFGSNVLEALLLPHVCAWETVALLIIAHAALISTERLGALPVE
jgi:hypothetical protein